MITGTIIIATALYIPVVAQTMVIGTTLLLMLGGH